MERNDKTRKGVPVIRTGVQKCELFPTHRALRPPII